MIRHIVAFDTKQGIAKGGIQPWYIPDDEAFFQAETKKYGGKVLMGARTYVAIKHPLRERENFVLTHDATPIPGAVVVNDLRKFLAEFQGDLWIIGGAEVFAQTLDVADELYITKIEADFRCDRIYPEYESKFGLSKQGAPKIQNGFRYQYEVYTPKSPRS
jgi:dihydrofolate reductase